MKYLVIFLFAITSCSLQQKKNIGEDYGEQIFTTREWKKIVVNELEKRLMLTTNSKRDESKIMENISLIKSKDNDYLEKRFSILGFTNKRTNIEDNFYLISTFTTRENHDESTYILANKSRCYSYLYEEDGFNHNKILKKLISKKRNKCFKKIEDINSLEMNSKSDEFFHTGELIIVLSCINGKLQLQLYHEITSSQDDIIEQIFYEND